MVDTKQTLTVIKDVLKRLDSKYYSDNAVDLIYHTGLVESRYKYLMQLGTPVARGFFQMEGATARDICKNYLAYRPSLIGEIEKICYLNYFVLSRADIEELEFLLTTNIAFSIIMCRLHYRRVPKPLPKTLKDQAYYWKAYYNTHSGKGTVEKFLEICK
jgi:hypothetical protein